MNFFELAWGAIILYCIVMYVILDGFTLGTAIMLPFMSDEEGDIAMSVILPTWDGNQTWLVLGFACLYGAFPLAFALLMPALYLPLLLMGIGLLFRGVAFEFRLKSKEYRRRWTWVFFFASLFIAGIQGAILGDFVTGFQLDKVHNVLVNRDFINPFSIFTILCLIIGYSLLGSTRLILKTTGRIRSHMYRVASVLAVLLAACVLIVSIWTPFINPLIEAKWLNLKLWPFLVILPAITGFAFVVLGYTLMKEIDVGPYWAAVLLFLCPYAGLVISVFPYIVPYKMVFWEAASGLSTLKFTFIGACIMLPVLTGYTYYSYRVFRGKVTDVLKY